MEARGLAATHSDTLELVAAQLGFRDWNTASAALNANGLGGPHFTRSVPVMLSLDEAKGHETTGSAVFVWMTGVDDYRRELTASGARFTVPEAVDQTWGREITVVDPFGNRLRFCERPANGAAR